MVYNQIVKCMFAICLIFSSAYSMDQATKLAKLESNSSPDHIWFDFIDHLDKTGCRTLGSIDEKSLCKAIEQNLILLSPEDQAQLRNCLLMNLVCFMRTLEMSKKQSSSGKIFNPRVCIIGSVLAVICIAAMHWNFINPRLLAFTCLAVTSCIILIKKILLKNSLHDSIKASTHSLTALKKRYE